MGFEGTFPTAVLSLELVTRRTAIPLAPQNEYLAADRAPLAIMLPQVRTPGVLTRMFVYLLNNRSNSVSTTIPYQHRSSTIKTWHLC